MRVHLIACTVAAFTALALTGCSAGSEDVQAEYIELLRSAPDANFEAIPDEQFLRTFDSRCEILDTFASAEEAEANAESQWDDLQGQAQVSEAEFVANKGAMYRAADATCD